MRVLPVSGTDPAAGTPAVQTTNASYVKIGTLVTVFFSITFSATGTIGTGAVTLINLPFTSKTQTGGAGTFTPAYFTNMNTSGPDKVTTMMDEEASRTKILVKVAAGTPLGILFIEPVTDEDM